MSEALTLNIPPLTAECLHIHSLLSHLSSPQAPFLDLLPQSSQPLPLSYSRTLHRPNSGAGVEFIWEAGVIGTYRRPHKWWSEDAETWNTLKDFIKVTQLAGDSAGLWHRSFALHLDKHTLSPAVVLPCSSAGTIPQDSSWGLNAFLGMERERHSLILTNTELQYRNRKTAGTLGASETVQTAELSLSWVQQSFSVVNSELWEVWHL